MILLFSQASGELGKWSRLSREVGRTFARGRALTRALLLPCCRISRLSDAPAAQRAIIECGPMAADGLDFPFSAAWPLLVSGPNCRRALILADRIAPCRVKRPSSSWNSN
jgi:hypothetical protein